MHRIRGYKAWFGALIRLGLLLILAALFAFFLGSELWRYYVRTRGIESGLAASREITTSSRLGTNVALERYGDESSLREALRGMQQAGLRTVRQRLSWQEIEPAPGDYHWEPWDRLLPIVHEQGFDIIVVLDRAPTWARQPWETANEFAPPRDNKDYARFARVLAARYGQWISAYQIWDEPNIAPHWGNGAIDPAGYVALLSAASVAIREGDHDAIIIGGGMAPNLESGGRNMSDVQFLHEIYRRGAGQWFDVLGIKTYGFWTGAYDRRANTDVLNYSRAILLREEMVRRGEAGKPVWALEGGWCALPPDWQGKPSPQGSDTPAIQADRTEAALQRMREEWPWMGLFLLGHWQPLVEPDDPLWGYALRDGQGQASLILARLERHWMQDDILYPGFTAATQLSTIALSTPLRLSFWGTEINLVFRERPGDVSWTVTLDGQDVAPRRDENARAWGKEPSGRWRVRLARALAPQVHGLQIGATPAQLAALVGIEVGNRVSRRDLGLTLLAGVLVLGWVGMTAYRIAHPLPWAEGWSLIRRGWARTPSWMQVGAVVAPFAVLMIWPSPVARLACLVLYGLAALLRPDVALGVAVAVIPTAPLLVRLPKGMFSLTEISILVAVASRAWNGALEHPRPPARKWRWSMLDIAVMALALWGLGSSFLAEYPRVAFREWRTVVLESAMLYTLLRMWDARAWRRFQLPDALWASGVAIAVYALLLYPLAGGVIEAEGVRRARAFYGSPNNLALYLDRLLPLGLAVAGWGQTRWRRWLYGLGSIPVALAILLTFSRGAWFLGVPAGVLVFAWRHRGRMRWLTTGLLLIALIAIVSAAGTERITSLLSLTSGTSFLRISLWQASWDMLKDHFWLGVGLDNFLYYYGDYIRSGAEVDRWLSHPHNILLDFGLRLGVMGLTILGVLVVGFGRAARHSLRACDPRCATGKVERLVLNCGDQHAMLLGLTAGMAAVLAHGMIDSAFFMVELAFWFVFALAWVQRRGPEETATAPVPPPPGPSDSETAYP